MKQEYAIRSKSILVLLPMGKKARGERFLLLLLFLVLVSCSEESYLQGEGTPVDFSLSGIDGDLCATTRDENLASGATVRVVAYKGTAYVAENTYTADGRGGLTATGGEMRLIADTYDFYAVSPALAIVSKTTGGPTFTVNQGVDFAAVKKTQAVAAYSGSNSSAKCSVALGELARKCAKLTFAIDLSEDVVGAVSQTAIAEVNLSAMPASLTATGATLAAGSGSSTLTLPANVFTTDNANPRKSSGSTVALPKTAGTFNLTLKARFNGVTSVTTLFPATGVPSMSFDSGKEYTFTVKLSKDNLGKPTVGLWLTICPWTTSNQDYGLGGVPTSPVTTQLLGTWTNITWDDVALGGVPTGPVITGVSGWWTNHYDHPHLGSGDPSSND